MTKLEDFYKAIPPGPYQLIWPAEQGDLFMVMGKGGTPPEGWAIPLVAKGIHSVMQALCDWLNEQYYLKHEYNRAQRDYAKLVELTLERYPEQKAYIDNISASWMPELAKVADDHILVRFYSPIITNPNGPDLIEWLDVYPSALCTWLVPETRDAPDRS